MKIQLAKSDLLTVRDLEGILGLIQGIIQWSQEEGHGIGFDDISIELTEQGKYINVTGTKGSIVAAFEVEKDLNNAE